MTERERKLLRGGTFDPLTQDEAAIKYAIDNAGGGGETIAVDDELDADSENPVQNKVIATALAALEAAKPLIVTGTFETVGVGNNTVTITTPLADIYAAASAGRAVYLEYTEDGVTTRMGLGTYKNDNGAYALGFSLSIEMSDKPAVAMVAFDNSLVGEFALSVWQ